jgi:hypothetical protein
MATQLRQAVLLLLSIGSLFVVWPFAFDWMQNGGNIMNPVSFFTDVYHQGGAAAFLTVDIAVVWIAYMIWVVPDAKRVGLGAKWGWTFLALSYLGTCFAFPLYLVVRERHLARQEALKAASAQ